jgi:hypothetical protein
LLDFSVELPRWKAMAHEVVVADPTEHRPQHWSVVGFEEEIDPSD